MKIGLPKVVERILLKPVLCALIPAIICYYFKNIYMGSIAILNFSRLESLLRLLLAGIVYLILFAAGLFLSRAIGRSDLQLFGRAFTALKEFR